MARELTPTGPGPDLTNHLAITPAQAAAVHRLIAQQSAEHHAYYRAALGLDPADDQP